MHQNQGQATSHPDNIPLLGIVLTGNTLFANPVFALLFLCSGKMMVGVNFSMFGRTDALLQDNGICVADGTSQNILIPPQHWTQGVVTAAPCLQRKAEGENPMELINQNVTKGIRAAPCTHEDKGTAAYTYVRSASVGDIFYIPTTGRVTREGGIPQSEWFQYSFLIVSMRKQLCLSWIGTVASVV